MELNNYIDWWKNERENSSMEDIESTFYSVFSDIESLPTIYHPILHKFLKNNQMKHWNNEIFLFTKNKIDDIEKKIGNEKMRKKLFENIQLLIYAYQNLLDIEERILLMNRFKGSEELKAKIFSINIYNDLLNTSFSNVLEMFIEYQSIIEDKNLYQKDLTPKMECLASQKRGYEKITKLANSDIRNAISHGGVLVDGSKILFSYRKGREQIQKESTVYEFKDWLLQLFDGLSAILLAWLEYLCKENITYNNMYENTSVHKDTSIFFEKLFLSTLHINCEKINQLDIKNQDGQRQQVNVEFSGEDLDTNSRVFLGLNTAEQIFRLRNLSLEDTIMISFRSPKTVTSFFIVDCNTINDLSNGILDLGDAWKSIIENRNLLMSPINDENRNEFEDVFRYYPDIETEDYLVTEIEDISHKDQKRFKATVYLKRAKRRNHVRTNTKEIVDRVKEMENFGFSSHKVKHGKIDADLIYLVIYKKEVRNGKDRTLSSKNNNFIAQVQYDFKMKFPFRNNFVDPHLKLRREGTIEYNWNPNF